MSNNIMYCHLRPDVVGGTTHNKMMMAQDRLLTFVATYGSKNRTHRHIHALATYLYS